MDHRFPPVFVAMAVCSVLAACSGGQTKPSSASSGSGGGTLSAASVSSVTTGAGGAGAGGAGGMGASSGGAGPCGGESFADAQPTDVNVTLMGELSPSCAPNVYTFTGQKGEILDIEVLAQLLDPSNPAPFDPTYIDTVVSLYDAARTKIAENDDNPEGGSNDSDLFTVLPADGTYYLRVEDCWAWTVESGKICALPKIKVHSNYELQIYDKTTAEGNVVVEPVPDPGNDAASAIPLKYEMNPAGGYYRTDVIGYLDGASDVDVYSFQIPQGVQAPTGQRLTAYFYALAAGYSQDGSTEPIGTVTITDALGVTVLAQVDGSLAWDNPATGGEIHMPASAATSYLLWVNRSNQIVGSNDFYALFYAGGGSNPVATGGDTMPNADLLMPAQQPNGTADLNDYYLEGDLAPGQPQWFRAPVPSTSPPPAYVTLDCAARVYGSGLQDLTADLFDDHGIQLESAVEPMSGSDLETPKVPVSTNVQAIFFSVSATGQDMTVATNYYQCGLHFLTQ